MQLLTAGGDWEMNWPKDFESGAGINTLMPSGHYVYRPLVTMCTASLTFTKSTFCPHSVYM